MSEQNQGSPDTLIANDNHYIEAGDFALTDRANRIVSGLITPYGETGTNPQGDFVFSAGTVALPADPSTIRLTVEHGGFEIGHAVSLRETERGIEADFAIDEGLPGDRFLSTYERGNKHSLSAEFAPIVRRGIEVVCSTLRGVAAVVVPGFESAALFSALDPEQANELDLERIATEAAAKAIAEALEAQTTDEAPAEPDTDPEDTPSEETEEKEFSTVENVVIPDGVQAPVKDKDTTSAQGLFSALAEARRSGNRSGLDAYTRFEGADFALGSIQRSGPSTVTIGADVETPTFLGELWHGKAYNRQFIPLFGSGSLTSYKVNGWRWVDGKRPEVDLYAGNNAEVPSNAVDTEPYSVEAQRIAGAHRVDRKFIDFSDSGFWESYNRAMVESYARKSDKYVLDTVVASATAVTPGTVPSGLPKALAAIADGALAVIAQENTPSFAVVDSALWRDVILNVGENNVLNYLSATAGLENGTFAGFQIVVTPLIGANKVLVGAKEAVTNYELPASPIRIEGLVPANGAVEPALYGYDAVVVHNAKALSLVTVASS